MRMERSSYLRSEPLSHAGFDREVFDVGDDATKVYAAPGYLAFIERMWHGDFQQVPVDPEHIDALIEALRRAQDVFAT